MKHVHGVRWVVHVLCHLIRGHHRLWIITPCAKLYNAFLFRLAQLHHQLHCPFPAYFIYFDNRGLHACINTFYPRRSHPYTKIITNDMYIDDGNEASSLNAERDGFNYYIFVS